MVPGMGGESLGGGGGGDKADPKADFFHENVSAGSFEGFVEAVFGPERGRAFGNSVDEVLEDFREADGISGSLSDEEGGGDGMGEKSGICFGEAVSQFGAPAKGYFCVGLAIIEFFPGFAVWAAIVFGYAGGPGDGGEEVSHDGEDELEDGALAELQEW